MNHKINLLQAEANLLRGIIAATGWCKTTQDIMLGGGLLADSRLPEFENIPTEAKAVKEWAKVAVPEFEVTEKERDAIKRAITHFVSLGQAASLPALGLLKAFGYTAE